MYRNITKVRWQIVTQCIFPPPPSWILPVSEFCTFRQNGIYSVVLHQHHMRSTYTCSKSNMWPLRRSWTGRRLPVYKTFWHTSYWDYTLSMDRCFYFPTSMTSYRHIVYSYFTLGNCRGLNIGKVKISHEHAFLIKNLSGKGMWCTKAVEWIFRQGLETSKHRTRWTRGLPYAWTS